MTVSAPDERRLGELMESCSRGAGVDGGGISVLAKDGSRESIYASDPTAALVERMQFTLGEGPCVEATAHGSPVLVPDVADGAAVATLRWPVFLQEISLAEVRAIFAFPLRIGTMSFGAVDLYRRVPGPLSSPQLSAALATVDSVGLAVLDMPTRHDDQLAGAGSNIIVHQAAGMAMVQLDSSIEEAMLRLRALAFTEGVPLSQVAADVVNGRRRLAKEET